MAGREGGKLNKMGPGFDESELCSPLYVGPSEGQEGWTPQNPEVPFPKDPLGYVPGEDGEGRRRR